MPSNLPRTNLMMDSTNQKYSKHTFIAIRYNFVVLEFRDKNLINNLEKKFSGVLRFLNSPLNTSFPIFPFRSLSLIYRRKKKNNRPQLKLFTIYPKWGIKSTHRETNKKKSRIFFRKGRRNKNVKYSFNVIELLQVSVFSGCCLLVASTIWREFYSKISHEKNVYDVNRFFCELRHI
jgi:hypothetical protein